MTVICPRAHDGDPLDQTTILLDGQAFQKVLDWMAAPATDDVVTGMGRLMATKAPWQRG